MPAVRVLVADDHAIVRNAVRSMIESIPGAQIVGDADNGIAAIALAKKLQPDVLVLDIAMPHAGGIAVLGEVRRFSPATRIVVLTGVSHARTFTDLQAAGVDVILTKSSGPDELLRGFRAAIAGAAFLSIEARSKLAAGEAFAALTLRERQVLSLAARGQSNAAIAAMLNISHKTVDNHRTSLMRKLDVHSVAELTATAIREGLTDG
jgi:DNA-binding NarL/FixJ family response regulator